MKSKKYELGTIFEIYGAHSRHTERVRDALITAVPAGATVMVVSKGDDGLLNLSGRNAWHFPRDESGAYAGFYPADSGEAIAHLEALRNVGGDYLVLPDTAFWWLDHYEGFRRHLEAEYQCIWRDDDCVIYRVSKRSSEVLGGA